jgi:hypothetical protein
MTGFQRHRPNADQQLAGQLKWHARRAAQRGDQATAERYLQILKTLLSPGKLEAFRSELKLTRGRQ